MMISEGTLERFVDADALAKTIAVEMAARLRHACATRRRAALLVPGGRSPIRLFEELRTQALDWNRVFVALADEHWVDPNDPERNEGLVRAVLPREQAATARFCGLKNSVLSPHLGAAAASKAPARVPRPFDVTLPGMSGDGHTASLFPGSPGLRGASGLSASATCVAMCSRSAPHTRLTLNLSALLDSRHISILIMGEEKLRTYQMACSAGSVEQMPIRGILRQQGVPVEVIWAPTRPVSTTTA